MGETRASPLIALTVLGVAAIWVYWFLAARIGPGFAIPVGVLATIATGAALVGPLGKALAQQMGLRSPTPPSELSEQVLGELDEIRMRMAELEERLDFSERLLAGLPKNQGQEQSKF